MTSTTYSSVTKEAQPIETARALRKLYFIRTIFSVTWVILVSLFAKTSVEIASILLIIYPAWDLIGTFMDIRANQSSSSKTMLYINAGISAVTTVAVGLALQKGIPETLQVFGVWAIVTGLIQLVLGLRRRKVVGGQWPMIISGGQSMLAGVSFILLAHDPKTGIANLAGYSAFGAFYYLLSAIRLSRSINQMS
ncbi:hypothetical protein QNI19_19185 [Cytophagaceae bacterium DM2B3-1]|uniref:DUF308 domain-containing protein n=1 Tax=Xanthocytophaga flava TaxID=3048013 RepID=A0ABT7CMV9_9BACT|nr:DUF308 domain-containing protein [Xanthocytophaga flavus]MDJ1472075.1 hypothetical protein [Xanthocytophaga flavus]MDJ1495071.1 hypothetical protein [Xanthocytophaga flavus]